jgi:outer membrane protein assembly factor BamB
MTLRRSSARERRTVRRVGSFLPALALTAAGLLATSALGAERCSRELQQNPCAEANPVCPAISGPVGLAAGSWPVFQGNVQHTGASPLRGPTCNQQVWSRKLRGSLFAAPVLAPGLPGEPETLFVPVGKAPMCALNAADGTVYWCGTDDQGKLADRSSPVIAKGGFGYVGTRDNDLWAIDLPPAGSASASVAWRQKVCTDGDITAPPVVGNDGLVYMTSDSLGAGTIMAMCPGDARQPKWCINPLGGGIRNASPALSPAGDELYVLFGGAGLVALDPQTGAERWRIQLEPKRSVGRVPNHAPVVNPLNGRIYLGLWRGLWAVDPPAAPGAQPTAKLLFDVGQGEKIQTPPAIDVERKTIVLGVTDPLISTLYALDFAGNVQWQRSDLGTGDFRSNNPPVIDVRGRIYLTYGRSLIALQKDGTILWRSEFPAPFDSSPILGDGRVYAGTNEGTVYAIGDCAP